jgi:hypothetical protein
MDAADLTQNALCGWQWKCVKSPSELMSLTVVMMTRFAVGTAQTVRFIKTTLVSSTHREIYRAGTQPGLHAPSTCHRAAPHRAATVRKRFCLRDVPGVRFPTVPGSDLYRQSCPVTIGCREQESARLEFIDQMPRRSLVPFVDVTRHQIVDVFKSKPIA